VRKARPRKPIRKVSPGLKGYANAKKAKIDLLRDVQKHVVTENAKSGNDHRSKDKIHVSEIVKGACPRMLFYKVSGEEATDDEPGAWHQVIAMWSAGSAEHEKWQRWLREMGDLWGTWFCLSCEHSWEAQSPTECENCGSGLLRYDEVNLYDDDLSLVGHADGAVPRLNALVEIKSFSAGSVRIENAGLVNEHTHKFEGRSVIDHDGLWKALKRPLKSHLIQGLFYLFMAKEMGLPYDRIIFIYESKTTQATKTFEVTLSDRYLRPFLEILTSVNEAAETGDTPDRPALYSKDAKPCTACPFRTKCWETDDDQSEESAPVPTRRSRSRSEEAGGEPEVQAASASRAAGSRGPRRRNGPGRSRPRRDDDGLHPVGRAPRRATRDGRGRREVGRAGDGAGQGPRFARRNRQGRDEDQG
jgi:rubrerythrin